MGKTEMANLPADKTPNAKRKPPKLSMELGADNVLSLEIDGDFGRLNRAIGNVSVCSGLVNQISILGAQGKRMDESASNFALGFVDAMEPRDAAEALLLGQMAAIHQTTMMMARRMNHVENIPQQDAAERALNKLGRTYAAQMDTLKRYRSKGQTVRVERVTIESGGQAIVGNVTKGGAHEES